jgi:hypothetical protein
MRLLPLWFLAFLFVAGSVAIAEGPTAAPEANEAPIAVIVEPLGADEERWACCHQYTWECFLLTEQECAWIDGIWFPGCTCEPNP